MISEWADMLERKPASTIVLWSGRAKVENSKRRAAGPAQVQLRFHPSPRVRWRFATHDAGGALFMFDDEPITFVGPTIPRPRVPPPTAWVWKRKKPGPYTTHLDDHLPPLEHGDGWSIHRMRVGLIDLTASLLALVVDGTGTREQLSLDAGDWRVTITGRLGAGNRWWTEFEGASAFTHVAEIERVDGSAFATDDAAHLRDALLLVLSFLNGSLVGQALPMGYDQSDALAWIRWDVSVSDPLRAGFSWYDQTLSSSIGPLVERCAALLSDPFWSQIVTRSIRMCVATDPDPLDAAIPVSMSALELLAWAHRIVAPPIPIAPGNRDSAADLIRGLLTWLQVPLTIPPELTELVAYAKSKQHPDLPAVLSGVRNRLVHPPNGPRSSWPSGGVMIDAWRMATECTELCILKMLGHNGNYGHRRHFGGRMVGDVIPVPWAVAP